MKVGEREPGARGAHAETEEQTLDIGQNECDVLDAGGHYKCAPGMSLEDAPVVVNITSLKGD